MPIRITREYEVSSGHHLPLHEGKCRNPHGHNYLIEVTVFGSSLQHSGPSSGMIMDFGDLDTVVKPILDNLDHKDLNETPYFTEGSAYHPPTAENIARWIWDSLVQRFPSTRGAGEPSLDCVKIYETKRSSVEVSHRWQ